MICMSTRYAEVLELLMRLGEASASDISRELGISRATAYRKLKELEELGILKKVNSKYRIVRVLLPILMKICTKYDVNILLKKNSREILSLLLSGEMSIIEIAKALKLSERSVRKILSELEAKGLVLRYKSKFRLPEDPHLHVFIEMISSRKALGVVYRCGEFEIVRVPRGVKVDGTPTAFSAFEKFGIDVVTPWDYYRIPREEVSLEDVIIHAILVSENEYQRSLIAILLAKYYDEIDWEKLKNLAIKHGVINELMKLEGLIRGEEPPNAFALPLEEILELARVYNVDMTKHIPKRVGPEFFEEISRNLNREVKIFLIGGAVMVLKGYKIATRDVDVVIINEEDTDEFLRALKKMGYHPTVKERFRMSFECKFLPRVDVYVKRINDKLFVTDSMLSRAEVKKFENLIILFASDTDLILMKAITGRMRDVLDIARIMRKGKIDWNALIDEMLKQEKYSGRHYCLTLLNALELVEEMEKLRAPILRRLRSITLEHMVSYAYFKLGKKTVREIREVIDFPEDTIRRVLKRILQKRKGQSRD